ncbi:MAG: TlpA disulfide reductase family protein [bacterium]
MPLRLGAAMPSLAGASQWANGTLAEASLAGKPVFVHFWALGCHICHENMPTINRWRDEYGAHGLVTIAIHVPRSEEEMDVAQVIADAEKLGITELLGIDNTHEVTDQFQNEFVPAYFLFDCDSKLAGRAAGHNGLKLTAPRLQQLFGTENI